MEAQGDSATSKFNSATGYTSQENVHQSATKNLSICGREHQKVAQQDSFECPCEAGPGGSVTY